MPFEYWIGLILIVAGVLLLLWWRARTRRNALAEVARQLGLRFEAVDWSPRAPSPQLESRHFAHNPSQSFRNSMSGERSGLAASFFDHVVRSRFGAHTDTIATFTQSVFLPEFTLGQQDILNEIAEAVVHRQITFPSDDAFSRFCLIGADEGRIRDLFSPDLRQFLTSIEPEWRIEASGHTLVMYQPGYTVKPDEYADFVNETTEIATNFFSHCHLQKPAF